MTNAKPKLTPAQQRAVDWLPADGSWRVLTREDHDSGLTWQREFRVLCNNTNLAEARYNSSQKTELRLTPAGIAMFHGAADDGQG